MDLSQDRIRSELTEKPRGKNHHRHHHEMQRNSAVATAYDMETNYDSLIFAHRLLHFFFMAAKYLVFKDEPPMTMY
jgi:hypothetical protein